jgi:serine/threonine-protein kinase
LFGGLGFVGLAFVGLIFLAVLTDTSTDTNTTSPSESEVSPSPTTQNNQSPRPSTGDLFGAIAYNSEDGSYGYGYNFPDRASAEARAIRECERASQGKACEVLVWFQNACGALARDGRNNAGSGWGETRELAQKEAVASCRSIGGSDCAVVETICAK